MKRKRKAAVVKHGRRLTDLESGVSVTEAEASVIGLLARGKRLKFVDLGDDGYYRVHSLCTADLQKMMEGEKSGARVYHYTTRFARPTIDSLVAGGWLAPVLSDENGRPQMLVAPGLAGNFLREMFA
ncbi:hypothetical protein HOT99_gp107 [Caulobacter phage CcrBL10]|uniref:Uncharacterized protein n=1 Tax=Caulobacter phage CcrBL10 TaxID=2283269 RepID=A0A385E9Z9_9CAUD|nr:hypothetical protein HOT99_gp107 [Caulobacter phage CcrBL10]AXQ68510.1 hypothetical protein CcrBL10_gp306 [Caulobacter phage CcrBL10]